MARKSKTQDKRLNEIRNQQLILTAGKALTRLVKADEDSSSGTDEALKAQQDFSSRVIPMLRDMAEEIRSALASSGQQGADASLPKLGSADEMVEYCIKHPNLLGLNPSTREGRELTDGVIGLLSNHQKVRDELFNQYQNASKLAEAVNQVSAEQKRTEDFQAKLKTRHTPRTQPIANLCYLAGLPMTSDPGLKSRVIDLTYQLPVPSRVKEPLIALLNTESPSDALSAMMKVFKGSDGDPRDKHVPKGDKEMGRQLTHADSLSNMAFAAVISLVFTGALMVPSAFIPPLFPILVVYAAASYVPGIDLPVLGNAVASNRDATATIHSPVSGGSSLSPATETVYSGHKLRHESALSTTEEARQSMLAWYRTNPNVATFQKMTKPGADINAEEGRPHSPSGSSSGRSH